MWPSWGPVYKSDALPTALTSSARDCRLIKVQLLMLQANTTIIALPDCGVPTMPSSNIFGSRDINTDTPLASVDPYHVANSAQKPSSSCENDFGILQLGDKR